MARHFLGTDAKFPISGKFEKVDGLDVVLQDLQILIGTIPGERVMRPTYGCNLYRRTWENIDQVAQEGVLDIRQAILSFEPRVDLLEVRAFINRQSGEVRFSVLFKIINTNVPQNLVFPFQTSLTE
jgi:uncharacterized protein